MLTLLGPLPRQRAEPARRSAWRGGPPPAGTLAALGLAAAVAGDLVLGEPRRGQPVVGSAAPGLERRSGRPRRRAGALLAEVATRAGGRFVPAQPCLAAVWEARLDARGDLVADGLDTDAVLCRRGAAARIDLPSLPPSPILACGARR